MFDQNKGNKLNLTVIEIKDFFSGVIWLIYTQILLMIKLESQKQIYSQVHGHTLQYYILT